MSAKSETYNIKMLNGLVVKDITSGQISEGIKSGKYLPSDFISTTGGDWIKLKETDFFKIKEKSFNGWMALFVISFILNILMLIMMFWQKSRIEQLLN